MLWDLFCRVIDNHGDLGVSLRLARNLVARGQQVRLWVDDTRALAWMASGPVDRLSIHPWPVGDWSVPEVGEVIIETFGCELPEAVQARVARGRASGGAAAHWLNLEYLSAESFALRSHRLPSPVMSGPAKGLSKVFWFPGFVTGSGGLLREAHLQQSQARHDAPRFLASLGVEPLPGERLVSLFCYPHAPLQQLAAALADQPTLLLGCGGSAEGLEPRGRLRIRSLPWLDQDAYDRLLWSCDLNVVRGEDSFVRAQWAGRPMLWHIYHQDDGAHAAKLQAYLDLRWPRARDALQTSWRAWNGLPRASAPLHLPAAVWDRPEALAWRQHLLAQSDLCDQLLDWIRVNPR